MIVGGSAIVSAGASSLTGLLVNVAAATSLSDDQFGQFSFVYVTVLAMMTLLRALCGEVVLFTDSSAPFVTARRSSTIAVVAMGAVGAVVLVVLGVTTDVAGYAAAAAFIPVCVQDNFRYLAFVAGRTEVAAASDLVTTLGPLAVVLLARNDPDAGWLAFLGWGASAIAGSLVAQAMLGADHSLRPSHLFAPELGQLRHASLIEFASTALLYQIPLLLLPTVASYADVGAMRGLQMVFSPVTILHAALFAVLVPRLTRAFESTGRVHLELVMVYIAVLTALTALIAVVVSQAPADWAVRVLGDTSDAVQDHAWFYGLAQGITVVATGATIVRRIERTYTTVARVRSVSALCAPVFGLVGAAAFGVTGACLGLAASQLIYLALLRLRSAPRTQPVTT